MFDADSGGRTWDFYIRDMINFGEKILSYTEGMDHDAFLADDRTYDAILRNLELIGEAATHVPNEVREAYPGIQWRSIIGTRNRVIHGYLGHHPDRPPGPLGRDETGWLDCGLGFDFDKPQQDRGGLLFFNFGKGEQQCRF